MCPGWVSACYLAHGSARISAGRKMYWLHRAPHTGRWQGHHGHCLTYGHTWGQHTALTFLAKAEEKKKPTVPVLTSPLTQLPTCLCAGGQVSGDGGRGNTCMCGGQIHTTLNVGPSGVAMDTKLLCFTLHISCLKAFPFKVSCTQDV